MYVYISYNALTILLYDIYLTYRISIKDCLPADILCPFFCLLQAADIAHAAPELKRRNTDI